MTDRRDDEVLPVMEEHLEISKTMRVTGRVRVETRTETVESLVPVDLTSTHVDVQRVPVDRRIDSIPDIVTEGDLTIVPVVEERIVVTRELYLKEELHIRRTERVETTEIPVSTRRQTAHVARLSPDDDVQTDGTIMKPKDAQNDL
jgi:stress response protein YsnF